MPSLRILVYLAVKEGRLPSVVGRRVVRLAFVDSLSNQHLSPEPLPELVEGSARGVERHRTGFDTRAFRHFDTLNASMLNDHVSRTRFLSLTTGDAPNATRNDESVDHW